jgi:hypothetical protein
MGVLEMKKIGVFFVILIVGLLVFTLGFLMYEGIVNGNGPRKLAPQVSAEGAKGNTVDEGVFQLVQEHGHDIVEVRDKETGVHYLIYAADIIEGGMGGMCPRYNADGTLYVTESGETNETR